MNLLKYGEMRNTGFAPTFDLVVYGFSTREANWIMDTLGYPYFERGEVLRRLQSLERKRKLPDGYTTCLSKSEVISFVTCLPSLLFERSVREARMTKLTAPPITDDDRHEMDIKARCLISSVMQNSEKMKMLRVTGREWQENPGRLLQKEIGIESC